MDFEERIQNILKEIGLTEIQASIYLYLLKSGAAPVSKVANVLKINRTNLYIIIDKLKSLNLIGEENRQTGKIVFAKSYKSILENLRTKEETLNNFETDIKSFIPVFNTFTHQKNSDKPRIRTYDGIKGLDEIVFDILELNSNNSEILLFTNQEDEKDIFSKLKHNDFIKRRVEKKIKIKALAVDNKSGYELQASDRKFLRETRILPKNFIFNSEIYIYDNKICMIDLKKDIIGVIIESNELYNFHKQIFEMLWSNL